MLSADRFLPAGLRAGFLLLLLTFASRSFAQESSGGDGLFDERLLDPNAAADSTFAPVSREEGEKARAEFAAAEKE
jgi:hypothetical protein